MIIFTSEHIFQLQGFKLPFQCANFTFKLIAYLFSLFQKLLVYFNTLPEFIKLIPTGHQLFFMIQLFHNAPSLLRFVPEAGFLRLLLKFYNANLSLLIVKDTPERIHALKYFIEMICVNGSCTHNLRSIYYILVYITA